VWFFAGEQGHEIGSKSKRRQMFRWPEETEPLRPENSVIFRVDFS
jgi:hypothetical protein